jgi:hypothetical protein
LNARRDTLVFNSSPTAEPWANWTQAADARQRQTAQ